MHVGFNSLRIATTASALMLGGCGTTVPMIAESFESPIGVLDATGVLEERIKQQVYCELKKAVVHATDTVGSEPRVHVYRHNKEVPALPPGWGVQVTINLQVDETGAVNPNFAWLDPLKSSQLISLGAGATLSSQGTRIDKFQSFYGIDKLAVRINPKNDRCTDIHNQGSSFLLQSNLGIDQWLQNALAVQNDYISTPLDKDVDSAFKQDVLSYEVKFIVITSGNITPSVKLVRVTANQGNTPFLSANRTRTHDLLITFGPALKPGKGKPSQPSAAISFADLAAQIGLYVGNNARLNSGTLPNF